MRKIITLLLLTIFACSLNAEDGYRLWLRFDKVDNPAVLSAYRNLVSSIYVAGSSPTAGIARQELEKGLSGLLAKDIPSVSSAANCSLIAGTPASSPLIRSLAGGAGISELGRDGFIIRTVKSGSRRIIMIAASEDIGVLYGIYHFLRLLQTQQPVTQLNVTSVPRIQLRVLNHWDNLDRTAERGYAGSSIWDWHRLPDYIDQRYIDYARANASIGINGTVLTNVNANALVLTPMYLEKVAALANVFRPYGIRVYLTARFSAPVEIGGLKTADPLNKDVQEWWKRKTEEIYRYIPDFGGFLVKANSEGQPGPQNYGRSHADGANMLADALAPHHGIVMWRAFVYSNETPDDRFKQAYNEFKPLDGKFRKNVLIQVKNGPIDFQPREPFHPLFGAMPNTPLMMEFQITQEYLGQGTQLVYLAPTFKETLDADTYAKGKNSPVSKIVDGSLDGQSISAIAGVSNIGSDRNWTGHLFGQANWYAFGRLAWDHSLGSAAIADEWLRQTFSNNSFFVDAAGKAMLSSHQILVNYMTPLGLHHIMGNGHHYGPSPWSADLPRADWNPVYYHRADSIGIGFDRTAAGSNALSQYRKEVADQWSDEDKCPDDYLLWFHHSKWDHRMHSGRTLWEELCYRYYTGVDSIRAVQVLWDKLGKFVDEQRFTQVRMLLGIQVKEAVWWRNACLLYFQTFSKQPIPSGYEKADQSLDYYKGLRFPYAPGN